MEISDDESQKMVSDDETTKPDLMYDDKQVCMYVPPQLNNVGNSCWLNALVQCICATKLSIYMNEMALEKYGSIATQLGTILQTIQYEDDCLVDNQVEVLLSMMNQTYKWKPYEQQDAAEALQLMLNYVEQGTKHDSNKSENDGTNAYTVAITQKKECSSCHFVSVLESETNNILPLGIDECRKKRARKKQQRVKSMIDDYLADELLRKEEHHIQCENCKCESDHVVSKEFNHLPEVLLLSIKRYNTRMQK